MLKTLLPYHVSMAGVNKQTTKKKRRHLGRQDMRNCANEIKTVILFKLAAQRGTMGLVTWLLLVPAAACVLL